MMQIQSDVLTISLYRPEMVDSTALGAAIAAGLATNVWEDLEEMQKDFGTVHKEDVFIGKLNEEEREKKWESWEWGVERSLGWIKEDLENKFPESTDGTEKSN